MKNENQTVSTRFRYYIEGKSAKKQRAEKAWRKEIAEYKKTLECVWCKKSDNGHHTLRIPQQCCAGSEEECDWDGNGKDRQKYDDLNMNLQPPEECTRAMHIGCARWSSLWKPCPESVQHVFWFPQVRISSAFDRLAVAHLTLHDCFAARGTTTIRRYTAERYEPLIMVTLHRSTILHSHPFLVLVVSCRPARPRRACKNQAKRRKG